MLEGELRCSSGEMRVVKELQDWTDQFSVKAVVLR